MIEYKVWGKSTNLLLYVVTDDGQQCLLSIFVTVPMLNILHGIYLILTYPM